MPVDQFRLVIPTRNGARWVGVLLRAYRELGVEPRYILDSRSSDKTAEILSAMGADVVTVTPTADRVEAMLAFVPDLVSEEWVLRLDDDELPSPALIDWLRQNLTMIASPTASVSRRDCFLDGGELFYSRLEDFYWLKDDATLLNPQWRLFKPRLVTYLDQIHTPGFAVADYFSIPPSAYFIHLDWVVRNFEERMEKIRNYDRQVPGGGTPFARFYLPELHKKQDLRLTAFEDSQFQMILRNTISSLPA